MGNIHTAKSRIYLELDVCVFFCEERVCTPPGVPTPLLSSSSAPTLSSLSDLPPSSPAHYYQQWCASFRNRSVSLLNVQYTSLRVCRVWWAYANLLGCIQSPRDQCSPHCRSFSQPQRTRCPSVDDPSTHVASLHVCNHLSDMEPLFSPPRRCI